MVVVYKLWDHNLSCLSARLNPDHASAFQAQQSIHDPCRRKHNITVSQRSYVLYDRASYDDTAVFPFLVYHAYTFVCNVSLYTYPCVTTLSTLLNTKATVTPLLCHYSSKYHTQISAIVFVQLWASLTVFAHLLPHVLLAQFNVLSACLNVSSLIMRRAAYVESRRNTCVG